MYATQVIAAILFCFAVPAFAQTPPALNLQLPPSTTVEHPSESEQPAPETDATVAAPAPSLPAPYATTYGDRRDADENGCDDEAYAKPQVHGSAGMGVAASNRFTANYETTELNVSKPLGNCDDQKGFVGASVRVTRSNLNFGHRNLP